MNEFKLLGRVGKLDIEYKENGDRATVITKISLGVKKGKDSNGNAQYENFYITFFNKKNHATAELLAEDVKEGDYIRVEGKLSINKYYPQGSDKAKYSMQLIGWGYKKVKWDSTLNKFVDIESCDSPEEGEEIVKFSNEEIPIDDAEIPF